MGIGHKEHGKFHPHTPYHRRVINSKQIDNVHSSVKPNGVRKYRFVKNSKLKKESIDEEVERIIKKSAVLAIASMDPHLATAYMLLRFSYYGYRFVSRVREEYLLCRSPSKAIFHAIRMEMGEQITSQLNKSRRKIAEFVADELWSKCIKENGKIRFYSPLENAVKQSMAEIIYLAIDKVI